MSSVMCMYFLWKNKKIRDGAWNGIFRDIIYISLETAL